MPLTNIVRFFPRRLRYRAPAVAVMVLAGVLVVQTASAGVIAARRGHDKPQTTAKGISYAAGPRDQRLPLFHRPAPPPPPRVVTKPKPVVRSHVVPPKKGPKPKPVHHGP